MSSNLRVLELLASRICHELVNPIGAIRNGMELIEEMNEEGQFQGEFLGEAIRLIDHSSDQAGRRLKIFRVAYGLAGGEQRGFSEVRQFLDDLYAGSRHRIEWPAAATLDPLSGRRGLVKALTNVLMLGAEALTHGGVLAVACNGDDRAGQIVVAAIGRPGRLNPELAAALAGELGPEVLTPRNVHAHLTGRFAENDGLRLSHYADGPERLVISIVW